MKTCLSTHGEKILLCDPCWNELGLVIVAGDTVVIARCEVCGRYANTREFTEVHSGGRKDAYGGICLLLGGWLVRKTHDYRHYYRGYWSEGGVCRIRIYEECGQQPVVICSQLPENNNTSVTNMAEYLAAEVIERHELPTPLIWIEHYPEHVGEMGDYSLVSFSSWEVTEKGLGGVRRRRVGTPSWSYLGLDEVAEALAGVSPNRSAAELMGR